MLGGPEEAVEAFFTVEHGGGAEVEGDFWEMSLLAGLVSLRRVQKGGGGWKGARSKGEGERGEGREGDYRSGF